MKRKLKWLAIILAVSLLGFGTALVLWPRDRITAESWKQIRVGMMEKEVEEILGGPGINEAEAEAKMKALEPFIRKDVSLREPEGFAFVLVTNRYWIDRRALIAIQFDQGHVLRKMFDGWRPADPTFIERVRDWLGW